MELQGHNMNLYHHNNSVDAYEEGDGFVDDATSWAPIMGASYGAQASIVHQNMSYIVNRGLRCIQPVICSNCVST